MAIQDRIFGKPLATSEARADQIGVSAGIPIFGLDALTSAAYGPEQVAYLLIPLGVAGVTVCVCVAVCVGNAKGCANFGTGQNTIVSAAPQYSSTRNPVITSSLRIVFLSMVLPWRACGMSGLFRKRATLASSTSPLSAACQPQIQTALKGNQPHRSGCGQRSHS